MEILKESTAVKPGRERVATERRIIAISFSLRGSAIIARTSGGFEPRGRICNAPTQSLPISVNRSKGEVDGQPYRYCILFLISALSGSRLSKNERYQYPRASPGKRRRCLLLGSKRRGISPCFPGTRSGMEPSRCSPSSRFVGESNLPHTV